MGRYRAVVVDLDGTILNEEGKINEGLADRIKQLHKNGNMGFSIATGRVVSGTVPFARQLDIRLPLILANGAMLYSPVDCKALCSENVPRDTAITIGNIVKETDDGRLYLNVFWGDTIYTERISSVIRKYLDFVEMDIRIVKDVVDYMETRMEDPLKVLVIGDDGDAINIAFRAIAKEVGDQVEMFRSYSNYLEIVKKGINKGYGLKRFAEITGMELEEIVAVGDSENDISMLDVAGLGVAVGNAMPCVKEVADLVIDKEDGEAICELIDVVLRDG